MFDVLTIAALADEFGRRLIDGRIQKVVQIDPATIALEVYAEHRRINLIAGISGNAPRLFITAARTSGDAEAVTPLLLLLRKYVRGGRIVAVSQPPLERILRIGIVKRLVSDDDGPGDDGDADEASRLAPTELIIELMGRRSNVILADDRGRVLDALKRVTPDMSAARPVLPGRPYAPPPAQAKADPRDIDAAGLERLLQSADPAGSLATAIVALLAGFSPQMAREVAFRCFGRVDLTLADVLARSDACERLAGTVAEVLAPLTTGRWEPAVYVRDGAVVAFAPIRLRSLEGTAVEEPFSSISAAIERALAADAAAGAARHAERRRRLVEEIARARERAEARVLSIRAQEERAREAERLREMGELIYAHLYEIPAESAELVVGGVRVPLDPTLSPSENAQAYFERYRKAKSAAAQVPGLLDRAVLERDYLAQLEALARLAEGFDEIERVRDEWAQWQRATGAAPARRSTTKRAPAGRPRAFRTPRGDLIAVGRNGPENERVTFEIAGPDDTWLHARGIPGSHVVARWAGPEDERTLETAASLAAWFSDGRGATNVEVDATARRYVRRLKGTGPGMVRYANERTLNVRPRSPEDLAAGGDLTPATAERALGDASEQDA